MECRRSLLLSLPLLVFACAIHLSEHEATNMLQVEQSGALVLPPVRSHIMVVRW